ncbi:MAG: glycosyltransferase, partial [Candidatus Promineifilaceae bacterium]|nr:glycosyltransferase [Candidatus Promineifilaceae bacterium]
AVARRVHLPGFVEERDKAALISGADGLLYPSLYEGFGFPIVEAQLCGTPVLCADSSSLPEVAGAGALLVDATDTEALATAIERLVTDEGLRSRLVDAGRVNAQRFTWERAAEQVLSALEAVGNGRR